MARTANHPALAYLNAAQSLPPVVEIALRVAVLFARWSERRRTRIRLSELDDHLLKDVGLDRLTALREARRYFWQQ